MKFYKSILFIFCMQFAIAKDISIDEIRVEGTREIPHSIILNSITIKNGDIFSFDTMAENINKIESLKYIESSSLSPKIEDGKLVLVINIIEKSDSYNMLKKDGIYTLSEINNGDVPPTINSITLDGNLTIEDKDILTNIYFSIGEYYSLNKIELAKSNIVRMGLFSNVSYTTIQNGKGKIDVTFYLTENNFIGSEIIFEGSSIFSDEELQKIVTISADSILDVKALKKDKEAIEKLYSDKDYAGVSVEPRVKAGNLVYFITEPIVGNVTFEKLSYTGEKSNLYTKEYVLRRVIDIEEGKPIKKSSLQMSINSIMRYGFFTSVTPDIRPRKSDPKIKDIVFKIIENVDGLKISGSLNGNFSDGISAEFGFANKNFLGKAQDMSLSFNYKGSDEFDNEKGWKGSFSLNEPWLQGTKGVSLGCEIYRSNTAGSAFDTYFGTNLYSGASFNVGTPIFKNVRISLGNDFRLVSHFDPTQQFIDSYLENVMTPSISYNSLNNYMDPTSGINSILRISWNKLFKNPYIESNFENKPDSISIDFTTKMYTKAIVDKNVIAARVGIGAARFISKYDTILTRFKLGGHSTLRGYKEKELKGNFYFLLNLEDRITLYQEKVKLEMALFFDIGFASEEANSLFDFTKVKKSIGLSFRLKQFLLPISIDFSLPLDGSNKYIKPDLNLGFTF